MAIERQFNPLIILGGLISSVICLVLVYFIGLAGFNLMGFYIFLIFPAGSIVVGIGSGIGYSVSSYLTHFKIKKNELVIFGVIALITYFGSQYASYLVVLSQEGISSEKYTFFAYYKNTVESMTFTFQNSDAFELGVWGWAFQVLEMIGFVAGAVIPSQILSKRSYCSECQLYMKKDSVYSIASGLSYEDLKQKKRKEKIAIIEQAIDESNKIFEEIKPKLKGSVAAIQGELKIFKRIPSNNYLAQIQLELYKCINCDKYEIKSSLISRTVDNKWSTKPMEVLNNYGI